MIFGLILGGIVIFAVIYQAIITMYYAQPGHKIEKLIEFLEGIDFFRI